MAEQYSSDKEKYITFFLTRKEVEDSLFFTPAEKAVILSGRTLDMQKMYIRLKE